MVEAQEPLGVGAIVGLIHDGAFGPSLMLGLGGIFTELAQELGDYIEQMDLAVAVDAKLRLR